MHQRHYQQLLIVLLLPLCVYSAAAPTAVAADAAGTVVTPQSKISPNARQHLQLAITIHNKSCQNLGVSFNVTFSARVKADVVRGLKLAWGQAVANTVSAAGQPCLTIKMNGKRYAAVKAAVAFNGTTNTVLRDSYFNAGRKEICLGGYNKTVWSEVAALMAKRYLTVKINNASRTNPQGADWISADPAKCSKSEPSPSPEPPAVPCDPKSATPVPACDSHGVWLGACLARCLSCPANYPVSIRNNIGGVTQCWQPISQCPNISVADGYDTVVASFPLYAASAPNTLPVITNCYAPLLVGGACTMLVEGRYYTAPVLAQVDSSKSELVGCLDSSTVTSLCPSDFVPVAATATGPIEECIKPAEPTCSGVKNSKGENRTFPLYSGGDINSGRPNLARCIAPPDADKIMCSGDAFGDGSTVYWVSVYNNNQGYDTVIACMRSWTEVPTPCPAEYFSPSPSFMLLDTGGSGRLEACVHQRTDCHIPIPADDEGVTVAYGRYDIQLVKGGILVGCMVTHSLDCPTYAAGSMLNLPIKHFDSYSGMLIQCYD